MYSQVLMEQEQGLRTKPASEGKLLMTLLLRHPLRQERTRSVERERGREEMYRENVTVVKVLP